VRSKCFEPLHFASRSPHHLFGAKGARLASIDRRKWTEAGDAPEEGTALNGNAPSGPFPGRGAPLVPRPAYSEAQNTVRVLRYVKHAAQSEKHCGRSDVADRNRSTFVGNAPAGSTRSVADWPQLRKESPNLLLPGSVLLTVAGNARTLVMPRETPAQAVLERSERVCACATRFERGCVAWTPAAAIFLPNQRATRRACRCV
jgi:hypothetical protein